MNLVVIQLLGLDLSYKGLVVALLQRNCLVLCGSLLFSSVLGGFIVRTPDLGFEVGTLWVLRADSTRHSVRNEVLVDE